MEVGEGRQRGEAGAGGEGRERERNSMQGMAQLPFQFESAPFSFFGYSHSMWKFLGQGSICATVLTCTAAVTTPEPPGNS